ncbi:MAG: (d)CMP kinase [Waddliaceae bacterium]
MIITIDGPVGTGKSTIAKRLAQLLGFAYFDTGAMYRCVTYGVMKHRIPLEHPEELKIFLSTLAVAIEEEGSAKHYFFEGEDITEIIRQHDVTSLVSQVSAIGAVRKKLVELQRQLASKDHAVFEGRDMGTVVFPEAEVKIYLTAEPEVRARRRFEEMREKFPEQSANLTFEEMLKQIQQRDSKDAARKISPLKQAEDACLIDTSYLSVDEVVALILTMEPISRVL